MANVLAGMVCFKQELKFNRVNWLLCMMTL